MFPNLQFLRKAAELARQLAAAAAANDILGVITAATALAVMFGLQTGADVVVEFLVAVRTGKPGPILKATGKACYYAADFFPDGNTPVVGVMQTGSFTDRCEAFALACEAEANQVAIAGHISGQADATLNPALIPIFLEIGLQVWKWIRDRRKQPPTP